jgi:hypothetical protein
MAFDIQGEDDMMKWIIKVMICINSVNPKNSLKDIEVIINQ